MNNILQTLDDISILVNRKNIIQQIINEEKSIIGYDFDGVLHTDVTEADKDGQKHPINFSGPYTPFDKIINQIKNQLSLGHKIYIVTARSKHSKPSIDFFLKNNDLLALENKVYYTYNMDKTTVLNNLKINEFYDDSCLRIGQLYNKMKKGDLQHLNKLYLVYPEKKSWANVHEDVQAKKDCGIDTN